VLIAIEFSGPVRKRLVQQLDLELDVRGNVATTRLTTSKSI
jgi:hypothetical protein